MHFRSSHFIIISSSVLFIISCSANKTNEAIINEINSGLEQSNATINNDSRHTAEMFKLKLYDPLTKTKAEYYYPKLLKVRQASSELIKYIEAIKKQVQAETNPDSVNDNTKRKSVNALLIDNNQYRELYKRLKYYREQVLKPDSMLLERIRDYIIIISKEQDTVDNDNFLRRCFHNASPIEAIAYLNRLQNNIAIAEMRCMRFYNESISPHVDWFKSYNTIVGQNAKVLRAGDDLEISGGVGTFSRERLLEFLVNGKRVEANEKGIVLYKIKTSKKPGNYSIPVQIRLLGEDSIEQKIDFIVEYSLVDAIKKR